MTSHRSERVADLIHKELARLLREEVRDPRIGFVTVTGVDLSPDLKHARVYVSIMDRDRETPLNALNRATPFLRRSLARHAGLRFTPKLRFLIDSSIDAGQRVESLLAEIERERSGEEDSADPPRNGPGTAEER